MAKWANDSVLDALLDKVATSTQLLVCSTQPTTRANALSSALASVTVSSGDFSKADGDPDGRTLTIAQKANLDVTASGTGNHIALVDGSSLLYVTTVTNPQSLTSGNTVTVQSWNVRIGDPA